MGSPSVLPLHSTVTRRWVGAVRRWVAAGLVWGLAWIVMMMLDPVLEVTHLALVVVLAAAVSSLWLLAPESMAACAVAVLAFNWQFVPPRGTLSVDLRQHALLLVTTLVVGCVVAVLMARQRVLAARAQTLAARAELLRAFQEQLRDASQLQPSVDMLVQALGPLTGSRVAVILQTHRLSLATDGTAAQTFPGWTTADQRARVLECLQDGQPLAAGAQGQPDMYLPVRGKDRSLGAVLIARDDAAAEMDVELMLTAQGLCDQWGVALERAQALQREQAARDESQAQRLRNTLLSAISHDYRTPLASILGAATSLQDQSERLSADQRERLLASIVEEVQQLHQLTDNTLQLARLDAAKVDLRCDWESAEDLVGSAVQRVRQRYPHARLSVRIAPQLPLLYCDAVLLVQLLHNLVDNALKYAPSTAPVEIEVRKLDSVVLLSVADRGPGVPMAWKDRIFDVFQRGVLPDAKLSDEQVGPAQRGAGVGLAVCRAIAAVHGGSLGVRERKRGGACFECRLPLHVQPAWDADGASAGAGGQEVP